MNKKLLFSFIIPSLILSCNASEYGRLVGYPGMSADTKEVRDAVQNAFFAALNRGTELDGAWREARALSPENRARLGIVEPAAVASVPTKPKLQTEPKGNKQARKKAKDARRASVVAARTLPAKESL